MLNWHLQKTADHIGTARKTSKPSGMNNPIELSYNILDWLPILIASAFFVQF